MNPTYVFAKTDAGEDAVVQRTRLVQRNLRTILILVDGKSTVADLVEKAGSAEQVNQALDQLEKDGFIRRIGKGAHRETKPASVAPASTSENLAGSVPETVTASIELASPFPGSVPAAAPEPTPAATPAAVDAAAAGRPVRPVVPASPFALSPQAQPSVNPFANSPAPTPVPSAPAPSPFQVTAGSPFAGSSPFGAPGPFGSTRNDAAVTPPTPAPVEDEPVESKPWKPKSKLLAPKTVLGALLGVIVILLLTTIFFPYGIYQPRIEAALTSAVGQPVRIGSVSASFLPAPTLVLSQVTVGEGGQVSIGEVRAAPSVLSLVTGKKSFSRITLVDTRVSMEQLGLLASGLSSAAKGNDAFAVGGVSFNRITLGLRDVSLAAYSGHADMGSDGGLKRMNLVSPDQAIRLSVEARGSGIAAMLIEAQNWKPGEGSPYVFDSLSIQGELTGSRLLAQKVEGRIFGGVIQGQFLLDWSVGMAVSGDISIDYMSSPQLASALGTGKIGLEGQVNGRLRFQAAGASWSAITGKVPLDGDVAMKSGAITGVDFVEAVRRGNQLPMRGGVTRFEQAKGKFRWDGQILQLNQFELSSGVVRVSGNMGVLKNEQITGVANVALKGSASTSVTPVSIVGTLKDPQLLAGRR